MTDTHQPSRLYLLPFRRGYDPTGQILFGRVLLYMHMDKDTRVYLWVYLTISNSVYRARKQNRESFFKTFSFVQFLKKDAINLNFPDYSSIF